MPQKCWALPGKLPQNGWHTHGKRPSSSMRTSTTACWALHRVEERRFGSLGPGVSTPPDKQSDGGHQRHCRFDCGELYRATRGQRHTTCTLHKPHIAYTPHIGTRGPYHTTCTLHEQYIIYAPYITHTLHTRDPSTTASHRGVHQGT